MATVCWLIQQVSLFWVHQGVSNTRQADNDVTTRSCKTFPRIDSAVAVTYVSEPSERGCDSKSRAESVNVCLKILWCLLFSISNAAAAHCPHVTNYFKVTNMSPDHIQDWEIKHFNHVKVPVKMFFDHISCVVLHLYSGIWTSNDKKSHF